MLIDIVFMVLLALAVYKGFTKGLVVAFFSMLAFFVGLAAAMKLSAVVAGYLNGSVNVNAKWLPIIAFVLVFVVVIILVRLMAALLEKGMELAMLGWMNKVGGIVLYILIYMVIYSIVLFYVQQVHLITETTTQASRTYAWIQPWGPAFMEAFGNVLPWFKNMFHELEAFFTGLATKMPKHT